MKHNRQTARDISYAYSARTYSGRAIIKILENITGRIGLIRKAKGYEHEIVLGESFWNIMLKRYGLSLEILDGNFSSIPKDGPLILVANHPFGILDGLILGYILSKSRQDFKILANQVFCKSDDLNDIILPISFDETKEASKMNIATRLSALNFLDPGWRSARPQESDGGPEQGPVRCRRVAAGRRWRCRLGGGCSRGLGRSPFGCGGLGLLACGSRLHSPKSSRTGSGPTPGSRRARMLPGWGSALKTPSVNIWDAHASHTRATSSLMSIPACSRPSFDFRDTCAAEADGASQPMDVDAARTAKGRSSFSSSRASLRNPADREGRAPCA